MLQGETRSLEGETTFLTSQLQGLSVEYDAVCADLATTGKAAIHVQSCEWHSYSCSCSSASPNSLPDDDDDEMELKSPASAFDSGVDPDEERRKSGDGKSSFSLAASPICAASPVVGVAPCGLKLPLSMEFLDALSQKFPKAEEFAKLQGDFSVFVDRIEGLDQKLSSLANMVQKVQKEVLDERREAIGNKLHQHHRQRMRKDSCCEEQCGECGRGGGGSERESLLMSPIAPPLATSSVEDLSKMLADVCATSPTDASFSSAFAKQQPLEAHIISEIDDEDDEGLDEFEHLRPLKVEPAMRVRMLKQEGVAEAAVLHRRPAVINAAAAEKPTLPGASGLTRSQSLKTRERPERWKPGSGRPLRRSSSFKEDEARKQILIQNAAGYFDRSFDDIRNADSNTSLIGTDNEPSLAEVVESLTKALEEHEERERLKSEPNSKAPSRTPSFREQGDKYRSLHRNPSFNNCDNNNNAGSNNNSNDNSGRTAVGSPTFGDSAANPAVVVDHNHRPLRRVPSTGSSSNRPTVLVRNNSSLSQSINTPQLMSQSMTQSSTSAHNYSTDSDSSTGSSTVSAAATDINQRDLNNSNGEDHQHPHHQHVSIPKKQSSGRFNTNYARAVTDALKEIGRSPLLERRKVVLDKLTDSTSSTPRPQSPLASPTPTRHSMKNSPVTSPLARSLPSSPLPKKSSIRKRSSERWQRNPNNIDDSHNNNNNDSLDKSFGDDEKTENLIASRLMDIKRCRQNAVQRAEEVWRHRAALPVINDNSNISNGGGGGGDEATLGGIYESIDDIVGDKLRGTPQGFYDNPPNGDGLVNGDEEFVDYDYDEIPFVENGCGRSGFRRGGSPGSDYDTLDSVSTYEEVHDTLLPGKERGRGQGVGGSGLTDSAIVKAGIAPPTAGKKVASMAVRVDADYASGSFCRLRGDGASTPSTASTSKS